jgi:uncharacterized membrane protein YeaQ/YmgE (transglycosylase-associated protein family)
MPIVLFILFVFLAIVMLIWLSFNVLGWIITLVVAGLVGWLADLIVPGNLPWGWLGAILAGLVGSWIGVALFGDFGPSLAGIPILPALLGAIILALLIRLIAYAGRRRIYA